MTLPPPPGTLTIATTVPAPLAEAFLQAVDDFFAQARAQPTVDLGTAETPARERDAGPAALLALLAVAEGDSAQAVAVARFLASLYDGRAYPFDLAELRGLDAGLFAHALAVLRLAYPSAVTVHRYVPDGQARWQRMIKAWCLDRTPSWAPERHADSLSPETLNPK